MVLPSGAMSIIKSPVLESEGKLVTLITLPKTIISDTDPLLHMITLLSGFNTKDLMGPLLVEDFPIRQFWRLISFKEMFLSSIHSQLGNPIEGDGSDMISSITMSYLFTRE